MNSRLMKTKNGTHVPRLAFILAFLIIICGPITGPQAIFDSIAKRGVFKELCPQASGPMPPSAPNTTNAPNATASVPFLGDAPSMCMYPCDEQRKAIEASAELFLSISNFMCVLAGVVMDLVGAQAMAVGGMVFWIVAKSSAGFSPASGVVWTVCESIAAVMSLSSYMGVNLVHLRKTCPDPRAYAFWCFVCSAVWDIAVLFNVPLAMLYANKQLTLWQAYMIYGCGAGIVFVVGLVLGFRDKKSSEAYSGVTTPTASPSAEHAPLLGGDYATPKYSDLQNSGDGETISSRPSETRLAIEAISSINDDSTSSREVERPPRLRVQSDISSETSHAPAVGAMQRVKLTIRASKAILLSPMYWLVVAHCSLNVTLGYFLVVNVGSFVRYLGGSQQDAKDALLSTTIMMSAFGLANYVPGRMIEKLGIRSGLRLCLSLQVLWLVSMTLVTALRDKLHLSPMTLMYVLYSIMFVWRVWGFGLCTPVLTWRFWKEWEGIGFAYGFAFTVSGVVSLLAGNGSTGLCHADPSKYPIVIITMAAAAAVVEVLLCVAVVRTTEADPVDDPHKPSAEATVESFRKCNCKNKNTIQSIQDYERVVGGNFTFAGSFFVAREEIDRVEKKRESREVRAIRRTFSHPPVQSPSLLSFETRPRFAASVPPVKTPTIKLGGEGPTFSGGDDESDTGVVT